MDMGYSTSNIGIILATAPLMRFAVPFLFLKYMQLNKKIFQFSLIMSILCALFFYITIHNFYFFVFNNLLLGIWLSLILPYIETIALKQLGKKKYGKSRLYGSIGFMFIALILAKFLDSYQIVLHYYLVMTIFASIFSFLLLKNDLTPETPTTSTNTPSFSILKYWPFWLSLFLMQISFGGFYNFFTIYELEHGVSLEMTSYLWSFGIICEILILYFQAPLLKKNLLTLIKFSIFITSIRWLLLYLFPNYLLVTFLAQSIHAFSFALYHSAILLALYSLYKNKKLAQQFMFGIAYGLGGFIGALIAGWLYGDRLFLYSAIISFLALLSLLLLKKRVPNTNSLSKKFLIF